MSDPVKIRFALDPDEDGWPPAESEGVWAVPLGGHLYRVDNTPWFARGVAAEDIIEARVDGDGVAWFVRVRERGGRIVVRVIPRVDGPLGGSLRSGSERFASLGVGGEGMSSPVNMVALDIGPNAPCARSRLSSLAEKLTVSGISRRAASPRSGAQRARPAGARFSRCLLVGRTRVAA